MSPRIAAERTKTLALRPAHSRLLPRQVAWAQAEATRILDQARERAAEREQQARDRARKLLEQARRRGEQAGRRLYLQRLLQLEQRWRQQLSVARRQARLLAIEMTRRLLRGAWEGNPDMLESIVEQVLEENPVGQGVEVVTAESAGQSVADLAARLSARLGCPVRVSTAADLQPGDLLVRGSWGEVDARLETQLETLQRLLEHWEREDG